MAKTPEQYEKMNTPRLVRKVLNLHRAWDKEATNKDEMPGHRDEFYSIRTADLETILIDRGVPIDEIVDVERFRSRFKQNIINGCFTPIGMFRNLELGEDEY